MLPVLLLEGLQSCLWECHEGDTRSLDLSSPSRIPAASFEFEFKLEQLMFDRTDGARGVTPFIFELSIIQWCMRHDKKLAHQHLNIAVPSEPVSFRTTSYCHEACLLEGLDASVFMILSFMLSAAFSSLA